MIIHLVSENPDIIKNFKKGKAVTLEQHSASGLKKIESELWGLVYLDLELWSESGWSQVVNRLLGSKYLRVALIDQNGWVEDPAAEFHRGVVDYLGPNQKDASIAVKRYKLVWDYNPPEERKLVIPEGIPLSGLNWDNVEVGKEYLFGFLYVALDNDKKLRNNLGPQRSAVYSEDFHNFLSHFFSMWDGYLWIKNEFGALILFPFDGKHFFPVEAALELSLNADFTHFSRFHAKTSFRMVAHCGSAVYRKRGDTGKMVSDTLNSIYHLGNKWADEGSFVLSEEAQKLIPDSLKPYFLNRGVFEGRETYRLKDRY